MISLLKIEAVLITVLVCFLCSQLASSVAGTELHYNDSRKELFVKKQNFWIYGTKMSPYFNLNIYIEMVRKSYGFFIRDRGKFLSFIQISSSLINSFTIIFAQFPDRSYLSRLNLSYVLCLFSCRFYPVIQIFLHH